jgi:hypothetical protein
MYSIITQSPKYSAVSVSRVSGAAVAIAASEFKFPYQVVRLLG